MKKLLASAIIAATPVMAQADLLFTVDAGASVWNAEVSGEVDDENIDLLISSVPKAMKIQAIEVSKAISDFDFNSALITLTNLKKLIEKESDR